MPVPLFILTACIRIICWQFSKLVDVQQVEILKGPQGTLFGRNAAAGAVNIRTNNPSDVVEGYIAGGVGSEDLQTTEGVINLPISDSLRSRTAFSYRKRDGWMEDLAFDGGRYEFVR